MLTAFVRCQIVRRVKFFWCHIILSGVKLSVVSNCLWCQIVRGVKLSWCQIVCGVKLSVVSNCPGVKLSGVKLSSVKLSSVKFSGVKLSVVSNCPGINLFQDKSLIILGYFLWQRWQWASMGHFVFLFWILGPAWHLATWLGRGGLSGE